MKLFWVLTFLLCTSEVFAQQQVSASSNLQSSPLFQSPNAASLGQYGAIDITPYNGLASINLNVFSLQEGDIQVTAGLNYFSGGVKLSSHPGWVGQNWSLEVGGAVTRKVNGGVDEVASSVYQTDNTRYAYYYHYNYLDNDNWATASYIAGLYPNNAANVDIPQIPNLAPDEFMFTLPTGVSGSFFLNHKGKWIVKTKSGEDLKVSVEVNTDKPAYPQPFVLMNVHNTDGPVKIDITRVIYKIEILDNNGFKYTFGNTPEAIEFNRGARAQQWVYNEDVVANTWYLTKIESPKNNTVDFTYERGVYQYVQNVNYPGSVAIDIAGGTHSAVTTMAQYSAQVISPSYLKKISSTSFTVDFTIAETTELKYDYKKVFGGFTYADLEIMDIPDNAQNTVQAISKWFKLTDISISDAKGVVKSKFGFIYNNSSTQRLFLKRFKKISLATSDQDAIYDFAYNGMDLPGYHVLQSDRWGYYNGKQFPMTISTEMIANEGLILGYLTPNSDYAQLGSLSSITYPTGGSTKFEYQLNDYSKVITKTGGNSPSISVNNTPGVGGGIRIWKITNTDNIGGSYTTEYSYNDPTTGLSSGILAGNRRIHNNFSLTTSNLATIDAWEMNDYEELNYTNGRDVVYTKVKKILPDLSYKLYTYSNSDTPKYKDEIPAFTLSDGYKAVTTGYQSSAGLQSSYTNPFPSSTSRELERGQLLSEEDYDAAGTLVHSMTYTYNSDPNRFDQYVRSYQNYTVEADGGAFYVNERYFQAIKTYCYYPYLASKTEKFIGQLNGGEITTSSTYTYGAAHRQLKETLSLNSKGEQLLETVIFNKDIIDNPSIDTELTSGQFNNITSMYLNRNMVVPVSIIHKTNNVMKERTRFSYTSNYWLDFMENAINDNALEKRIMINKYDTKGNILESQKNNDMKTSYLYEYNVPVAEVANADAGSIAYTGFESSNGNWNVPVARTTTSFTGTQGYDLANGNITSIVLPSASYRVSFWSQGNTTTINSVMPVAGYSLNGWTYYEAIIPNATTITIAGSGTIDELRLCPKTAQMITYVYNSLVGYTAKIDANGNLVFYEYDNQNRLKLTKDNRGNILKKYEYNYQVR